MATEQDMLGGLGNTVRRAIGPNGWIQNVRLQEASANGWIITPWYPSPKGGTYLQWQKSYLMAATLVSKMSLVEKVNITTGTGWASDLCVGNTAGRLTPDFLHCVCRMDRWGFDSRIMLLLGRLASPWELLGTRT